MRGEHFTISAVMTNFRHQCDVTDTEIGRYAQQHKLYENYIETELTDMKNLWSINKSIIVRN